MRNIILPFAFALVLVACEPKGPAERAGEEVDEAIQSLQRDAGETQEQIDDAVDEIREDASDAIDEATATDEPRNETKS